MMREKNALDAVHNKGEILKRQAWKLKPTFAYLPRNGDEHSTNGDKLPDDHAIGG